MPNLDRSICLISVSARISTIIYLREKKSGKNHMDPGHSMPVHPETYLKRNQSPRISPSFGYKLSYLW